MKIEEVKHNHSLTDLLKIILFAILMLAPIGSVATRCLYVICNKNAYQSYSDEMIEKVQSITSATQINEGDIITWNYIDNTPTATTDTNTIYFTELSFNPSDYGFASGIAYDRISISSRTNAQYIMLFEGNSYYYKNIWGSQLTTITIKVGNTNTGSLVCETAVCYKTTYQTSKLDNVFEYSVNQLENDQLFSWTENTLIYTGINNMCTQLNITIAAIPMILTYWLMLTCIYVIIDIVLKLFTLLTHMIGNRKA